MLAPRRLWIAVGCQVYKPNDALGSLVRSDDISFAHLANTGP